MLNHFRHGFEKRAFVGLLGKAGTSVLGRAGKVLMNNKGKALGVGLTGLGTYSDAASAAGKGVAARQAGVAASMMNPASTF